MSEEISNSPCDATGRVSCKRQTSGTIFLVDASNPLVVN